MFLVIFNLMFGGVGTDDQGEPVNLANFFVPGIVVFAVVGACYTNIAMGIAFSRDGGCSSGSGARRCPVGHTCLEG